MSIRSIFKSLSHWGVHKVAEEESPREIVLPAAVTDSLTKRLADDAAKVRSALPLAAPAFGSQRYLLMSVLRYAKHPELGLVGVLAEAEDQPYAVVVTMDHKIHTVCFWSLTPGVTPTTLKEPA